MTPTTPSASPPIAPPAAVRTYVPGHLAAKVGLAAVGLVVAALGVAQLHAPLSAALVGERVTAEVVRVILQRPGQPDEVFADLRPVPVQTAREALFLYEVRAAGAEPHRLTQAHRYRPVHAVGDTVRVALPRDAGREEPAHALREVETWAPGGFLLIAGLTFTGAFAWLAVHARRPIVLPADTPAGTL